MSKETEGYVGIYEVIQGSIDIQGPATGLLEGYIGPSRANSFAMIQNGMEKVEIPRKGWSFLYASAPTYMFFQARSP